MTFGHVFPEKLENTLGILGGLFLFSRPQTLGSEWSSMFWEKKLPEKERKIAMNRKQIAALYEQFKNQIMRPNFVLLHYENGIPTADHEMLAKLRAMHAKKKGGAR